MVHTSDIARLALAYKYGGFYLDLDIIVLRSLKELHNFLILENGKPSMYATFSLLLFLNQIVIVPTFDTKVTEYSADLN